MALADARRICEEAQAAASSNPALGDLHREYGADFLAWWSPDPPGNTDQDLLQWLQITASTAGIALNVLGLAREETLPAADFRTPAREPESGLEALIRLRLAEETVFIQPDGPVDTSSTGMLDATLVGALCWQPDQALNIVPFVEQSGNDAPFGHVIVDPAQDLDGPLPMHAGALWIGQGGSVASAISIDSNSLCGATLRTANTAMHYVVNALWQAERRRRN